ncbi:MAG: hypothetical protein LC750_05605 [Actinobacteria bacterium]|nr:hypothetical protein [Actinomycetota bacterium]
MADNSFRRLVTGYAFEHGKQEVLDERVDVMQVDAERIEASVTPWSRSRRVK